MLVLFVLLRSYTAFFQKLFEKTAPFLSEEISTCKTAIPTNNNEICYALLYKIVSSLESPAPFTIIIKKSEIYLIYPTRLCLFTFTLKVADLLQPRVVNILQKLWRDSIDQRIRATSCILFIQAHGLKPKATGLILISKWCMTLLFIRK